MVFYRYALRGIKKTIVVYIYTIVADRPRPSYARDDIEPIS